MLCHLTWDARSEGRFRIRHHWHVNYVPLCWSYSWTSTSIDPDHGESHWFTSMSNSFMESNVPLCSDWTFATRIVVIGAIVATSENSVTSYSMQSRAGRTWCIRSKNSTDISAIRVCRYELSQVSTEIHSCNHEFGHWVSSPSRLEARTWQYCLSLDWMSLDTENNVSWHHQWCGTIFSSCARKMSRSDSDGLLHRCSLMTGDPKVHGLRNECDDRVRYVKRRHLEVKYLRLQQVNYTEHLRIDADHLDITQLTKLSCLGPRCGHTFQRSYWKGKSFCFLTVVSDSSPSATLGPRRIEACPASSVSKQRRERQTLVQ